MFEKADQIIIIFILTSILLILLLVGFITIIIFRYQQKQNAYFKEIETLKAAHENTLLQSQLEMQEQTFQHISREIHDNIGQKLSLAKLHLNTIGYAHSLEPETQVTDAVSMISEAINDLSDISHSMSSENILNNGLIKALEFEVEQLKKSGIYQVHFSICGNPVFLNASTELVLFRIVQEATNNIIKHAAANTIDIQLHYENVTLIIYIADNGKGFVTENHGQGTGLLNMKKRAAMLNGKLAISSTLNSCTQIKIEIPINETCSNV